MEKKFDDPRMQQLHEQCEARAAANKAKDDQTRLEEYERKLRTGEVHSPTQARIIEIMEAHQADLSDNERAAQCEALIEETERKLLGLPPLPLIDIDSLKVGPEDVGSIGPPALQIQREKLRVFILTHGRAPTSEELRGLL